MIHYLCVINRFGHRRLSQWYTRAYSDSNEDLNKAKSVSERQIIQLVLSRSAKMCNFVEWRDKMIVFRRYASLYFILLCTRTDNPLIMLEFIRHFVEILDTYYANVCELDLVFNLEQIYHILGEMLIGGEMVESSKNIVLECIGGQDLEANPDLMDLMGYRDDADRNHTTNI